MILGTGIDMIEIARVEKIYHQFGETFLKRVYTLQEREYSLKKSSPGPHLAARFAAKEACAKALGTGFRGLTMVEIGVLIDSRGRPYLELTGGALATMRERGIGSFLLSLSHCREYAIAHVLALTEEEIDSGGCHCRPDAEY